MIREFLTNLTKVGPPPGGWTAALATLVFIPGPAAIIVAFRWPTCPDTFGCLWWPLAAVALTAAVALAAELTRPDAKTGGPKPKKKDPSGGLRIEVS